MEMNRSVSKFHQTNNDLLSHGNENVFLHKNENDVVQKL